MKTGAELHYLSGQVFTIGVLAMAILPRMPFDELIGVGGKLSHPFRRALLMLVGFGMIRVLCCHLLFYNGTGEEPPVWILVLDTLLGTMHVVGQSFLCLCTAYLLQCQLVQFINIDGQVPGRSLVPYLILVFLLTVFGSIGSSTLHPNLSCLDNLAEAISCLPVLKTLKLYADVSTSGGAPSNRSVLKGPIIIQLLFVFEYYYFTTAALGFFTEAFSGIPDDEGLSLLEGHPLKILLEAVRQNQDSGIDDWTRLLIHSIFLNSLDEMHHVTVLGNESPNGEGSINETERHGRNDGAELSDLVVFRNRPSHRV